MAQTKQEIASRLRRYIESSEALPSLMATMAARGYDPSVTFNVTDVEGQSHTVSLPIAALDDEAITDSTQHLLTELRNLPSKTKSFTVTKTENNNVKGGFSNISIQQRKPGTDKYDTVLYDFF